MKEQPCLIPGTPTKPERPQTRKELSWTLSSCGLEEEHKEEESCTFNGVESSEFFIDLNKPACSWGDNAESSHETQATCLVSGGAYADTKQLDHSEKLSSKLDFVPGSDDAIMLEKWEEIHTKEPSEKVTSKLDFVQDDLDSDDAEYCEEIQVKTTRKPKRKRYMPKVVIDDKLAPKKLPKSAAPKEKKPRTRKTPEQNLQIPATPKQTKEKKSLKEANLPVLEEANLPNLEFQSQHLEAKDFQSEQFPVKPNRQRSKRRRRLHLFNLIDDMHEIERRKCKESNKRSRRRRLDLFNLIIDMHEIIRWSGSKKRSSMNRPLRPLLAINWRWSGRKKRSINWRWSGRKKRSPMNSGDEAALVLYDPRKKKSPEVLLDSESLKIWNLLMNTDDDKSKETPSEEFKKEREKFVERISSFNACMYQIQGDRGFRKWGGSVIDSVVGVFLTQNVSDHLSSSAYMKLASMFPLRNKFQAITWSQESVGRSLSQESIGSNLTEYDAQGNLYFVNEPEPESKKEVREVTNMLDDAPELCVQEVAQMDENTKLENEDGKSPKATEHESSKHEDATTIGKSPQVMKHESPSMDFVKKNNSTSRGKTRKTKKSKKGDDKFDWDSLRRDYSTSGTRSSDQMDSVDWNAVRLADPNMVATAIKQRGQHNMLATRIQKFLNRVVKLHKSLDLEWLRTTPPGLARKYLLGVKGLGLKSVECVDTNVARITVRLGWVPLQPLPEELQIHLLEQYPIMDSIQKYLWPRLCELDHKTLYELHYQMITFGKVFCTKRNPNCNACPMRTDCKHFASAFASSRLALPGPSDKREAALAIPQVPTTIFNPLPLAFPHPTQQSKQSKICELVIEEPNDIEELPTLEAAQSQENDDEIEYDSEGIPIIKLNLENFKTSLRSFNGDYSKALVALNPYAASISRPKLKNVSRLRTEHQVYELPRNHPLLHKLDQTETDNETQYHLAIWRPGETVDSLDPPKTSCNSIELYGVFCNDQTCFPCNSKREEADDIIPCRVAMGSKFPLNGTYFQMNEVFTDYETSRLPLKVPRKWIGNLRTKIAYFGTSMTAISRGLSTEEIQKCFWNGVVCVRGFEQGTKIPKPLGNRFHKKITSVQKRS
ncbi:hypothetical protein CCACVL1_18798 [Corchorus capsularis]|uniref:HhH-GPD domain-containing protein n=1 Tax=Corchorus capsularis TaxID=210143 RepID=A0A1R3HJT2_COCAP|nr:hypothetical protein CCACVL1_18798 [Corchorus capsularis]